MKETFLTIPYYKNKPLVVQIKKFDTKEEVCNNVPFVYDECLKAIHSLIEHNDNLTHKQKAFDFLMADNNFHIYVLYVSDNENKLFLPEKKNNGKISLKKIKIGQTSFIPEHKIFEFEDNNN